METDWITNINEGNLDSRFIEIINVIDMVEATIPEEQRKNFYNDLEYTMENRRLQWGGKRRKKLFGIF